jgi:hypothetical protein
MSSKGVIVFAKNNGNVDYVKQAAYVAKRVKQYMGLPTTIVTDSPTYAQKFSDTFDEILKIRSDLPGNLRNYYDGYSSRELEFKNSNRFTAFKFSPYDETILIDTDFIIANDSLNKCFDSNQDFMLYKNAKSISSIKNTEFDYISDASIDFYWATVVYFKKTELAKTIFELVEHIQEEWKHYRRLYQIKSSMFRNDFAFSIALHILNDHKKNVFIKEIPGVLHYTTDRDVLDEIYNEKFTFLLQTDNHYQAAMTKGMNVHIMNKFSLERHIDKEASYG